MSSKPPKTKSASSNLTNKNNSRSKGTSPSASISTTIKSIRNNNPNCLNNWGLVSLSIFYSIPNGITTPNNTPKCKRPKSSCRCIRSSRRKGNLILWKLILGPLTIWSNWRPRFNKMKLGWHLLLPKTRNSKKCGNQLALIKLHKKKKPWNPNP